jgi:hypothetical protein
LLHSVLLLQDFPGIMCRFLLYRERAKIQHVLSNCYVCVCVRACVRVYVSIYSTTFGIQLNYTSHAIADDMPYFLRSKLNQLSQFTISSFLIQKK